MTIPRASTPSARSRWRITFLPRSNTREKQTCAFLRSSVLLFGGSTRRARDISSMSQALADVARALAASPINKLAVYLLSEVPGFPPIVQTVHILSIAAIMGSVVLIDLRVLGLALPSQSTAELVRRLMPWTWWALPVLAVSGLVFVCAQPARYLSNPVFGLKFAMLAPAIIFAAVFQWGNARDASFWERSRGRSTSARAIAAFSLLLWVGVVMAGRWIAYADYLFPE